MHDLCNDILDLHIPASSAGAKMEFCLSAFLDSSDVLHIFGSTDSKDAPVILYNSMSEGLWVYGNSAAVISYTNGLTTIALGSVLYSAANIYNGYKYVMFFVNQPYDTVAYWAAHGGISPCILEEPASVGWGILYVSYSNSPNTGWTTPCQFTLNGTNVVYCEACSAVYHSGTVYLTIFEGSFAEMIAEGNTVTYAYVTSVDPDDCAEGTRISTGYFNDTNITGFNPDLVLTSPNTTDDYPMLFNLDTAIDITGRYFYITRSYAYPFDVFDHTDGEIPCNGTPIGMASLPQRAQLYRKSLGNPINFANLYSGSWEMIIDVGFNVGEATSTNDSPCQPCPLQVGQDTFIDGDVRSMNILRTPTGEIHSKYGLVMAVDTKKIRTTQSGETESISVYVVDGAAL